MDVATLQTLVISYLCVIPECIITESRHDPPTIAGGCSLRCCKQVNRITYIIGVRTAYYMSMVVEVTSASPADPGYVAGVFNGRLLFFEGNIIHGG